MSIFCHRILRAAYVSVWLIFTSFSVSAEQLIIKFSSSITGQQSAALLSDYGLEIIERIDTLDLCTVAVPEGNDIEQLINSLELDERIKYVEKNMDSGKGVFLPNDALIEEQWHHATIKSERAWDISRGSSDIMIAVLDSGLRLGSAEFTGERFLTGFDFVNNDDNADDGLSHGTYVTGLITANANNGISGAGIDHNATILPVKVISDTNTGFTFDLVQGISYAVSQGADVINMSLGGYPNASSLNEALSVARNNGVILVTSAGNGGIGDADNHYPGTSPHTISVGSTDINNNRAFSSSTGVALDVVAPGGGVSTTSYLGNDGVLDFFNGTSAAAPMVAGVAGLAKALDPDLTQDEFLDILILTSRDQVGSSNEDTPGRDDFFGWGLIDAHAVLERVNPGHPEAPVRIEAQSFTASFDSSPGDNGDDVCNTGDVDSQTTTDLGGICNIGWTTSGEWLEYDIFVDQPGLYDVNLRLASRSGGSVSVQVDGIEIDQVLANTGNWQSFADHVVSTQLSHGTHTIRVNFVDGGVNFNFLDVQLVGIAVPALIQAENHFASFDTTPGNRGNQECDTGDVDAQFTDDDSGFCNIGWVDAGEWLEYGVFVDQPGTYFMNLRLASGPGGDVSIDVEGIEVERVSVNANGWQVFSDHIVSTQLREGLNTIRVNFINGGVNFNFIEIQDNLEITLNAEKDAYIRGGSFSDDNFGSLTDLVIKDNNNDEFSREAYLQFDISELAGFDVQRAIVRLYANRIDESLQIALHRITANNASESDISWNNTADEGDEVAVTSVFSSAGPRYYEWDVTDYLQEEVGFNTFNILIKERNAIDEFVEFNSREASSNPPQLVITRGN